jgi:hydrogenase expression/formation protein HypD
MKYIDEYRDPLLSRGLLSTLEGLIKRIGRPVTIMEICGSHTFAIARFGLRDCLSSSLRLISGPGCPVCVTSAADIDGMLYLAKHHQVTIATFGDMLRVPGTGGVSLQQLRAGGARVETISSAMEALKMAETNPDQQFILLGIGFETTAPTVAATVMACRRKGIANLSVFSVHKTIPQAIRALIDDRSLNIDGFFCPGHVSTITGAGIYDLIPQAHRAAVITGFEPVDILEGLGMILGQLAEARFEVAVQYERGVRPQGNHRARAVMNEVFTAVDAEWRGLGVIPGSGLALRDSFADFDARRRFPIPVLPSAAAKGCECGSILRGVKSPDECPLYRKVCHPANPLGPCMVSAEGTCAAYYKYYGKNQTNP